MRKLLRLDFDEMTRQVTTWLEASAGRWTTRFVELVVPGPTAEAFHAWYNRAWREGEEESLRAVHPEHFMSHPLSGNAEVIENIGETPLPWRIIYAPLPEGEEYPTALRDGYPVRFGSQLLDGEGRRIGYTLHELRDETEGTRMVLTTCLPATAPPTLSERHLRHFCIEFRNWAAIAVSDKKGKAQPESMQRNESKS